MEDIPTADHNHGNNNISFSSNVSPMKFISGEIRRNENDDIRKVMHREYERQRRQHMSTLLASLRSLLPAEHIQGKRSLSDHMQEAVNYIKQLEKNVGELRLRRDKLRKEAIICDSSNDVVRESTMPSCVTVNSEGNWIEILISCSIKNPGFSLSGVIVELIGRKLNVISCVCTKNTNTGVFFYTIQAEADDRSLIDVSTLQERLSNAIN